MLKLCLHFTYYKITGKLKESCNYNKNDSYLNINIHLIETNDKNINLLKLGLFHIPGQKYPTIACSKW